MRDKGPGRGTADDRLHHRCLDFEISAFIEVAAYCLEYQGALHECFADACVHEEIDVALAVAQFHICQAMILLRQRQHGLGEKRNGLYVQAEFAGAGAEEVPAHSNVIAEVEQLVELEGFLSDRVQTHINLQTLSALLQMREPGLALAANCHESSGDGYGNAVRLKVFGGAFAILLENLRNRMRGDVLIGIGLLPQSGNVAQFFLAKRKEISLKV